MGGRKGAVAPTIIVDAVLFYKDEVVINNNGEKKVAVATDSVWSKVSTYLNNRISSRAIHTFVHKDRYNVKEKLGFPSKKPILVSRKLNTETQTSYETDADELQRTYQFKECFMWWEDLKMVFGLGISLADNFVGRVIRLSKSLLYG